MFKRLKSCFKSKKQKAVEIPLKKMEGLLIFTHIEFPLKAVNLLFAGRHNADILTRRYLFGFYMAKTIVSLHVIEIMLKYAHQEIDKKNGVEIKSRHGHNIVKLFRSLPEQERHDIGVKYEERVGVILHDRRAKEVIPLDSLIKLLRGNPITDMRYFWERSKGEKLPQCHNGLEAFSYGIAVGACNYPDPNKPSNTP